MEHLPEIINIKTHGATIRGELFQPAASSRAVVIAHGSDGMNQPWDAMIREYAVALSAQGFTVLIPYYFESTGTTPGIGVFSQIPAHIATWSQAVSDGMAHIQSLPGLTAAKVGLLGFSLGGNLCLRLRTATTVLVEYFAPEFPELGGIGTSPASTLRAQIHHGLADQLVPFQNAQAIEAALKASGAVVEIFSYEAADHGFVGSDPHNATARRSSHDRTLKFFENSL